MLFTVIMMKTTTYSVISVLLFAIIFSCSTNGNEDFSDRVKISLREVGNQLLLHNQDSVSLVLPIKAVTTSKYQLSFQNKLSIHPDSLVSVIQSNFKRVEFPKQYRVEVIQCEDDEVAYSYQISADKELTIIPCIGRELPLNCYQIEVKFLNDPANGFFRKTFLYVFGIITIIFVLFGFLKKKKSSNERLQENYTKIGRYKFYKAQNKLVKEAQEITLSKKECELLDIFVARPNEVITRDELTKRVWEDNGVIVGRSLDTFISKLRKKLKDDESIKLTNVHGVGYKLEII